MSFVTHLLAISSIFPLTLRFWQDKVCSRHGNNQSGSSAGQAWRLSEKPKKGESGTREREKGRTAQGKQEAESRDRMNTPAAELELAISHLLRAKELAPMFTYPQEIVERIDLIKRATANVRQQALRRNWLRMTANVLGEKWEELT